MFDRKAYMAAYHKAWYIKHKPQLLKRFQDYAALNRKELIAYKAEWYRQNAVRLAKKEKLKHKTNPLKRREKVLKLLYGLTLIQYAELSKAQSGRCRICGSIPPYPLHVDHDHQTKRVRGLLCRDCNFGLGLFKDNPTTLVTAGMYLKGVL